MFFSHVREELTSARQRRGEHILQKPGETTGVCFFRSLASVWRYRRGTFFRRVGKGSM
ncbi:unnamed protein product [Ectocarpus sp. 6 AP-2014]